MVSSDSNALIVWDRCGDYHIARWKNLAAKNIFKNVFLANLGNSDNLYKWQGTSESVISLSNKPVDKIDLLSRLLNFNSALKKKEIGFVLLSGYGRVEYILFILLCAIKNKKVILFAESWYDQNPLTKFLKRVFLRFFVDGIFVSGERAMHHFKNEIGLKTTPMEIGYSAVDNEHFSTTPKTTEGNNLVILCVARYSKEKNLLRLIDAFRKSKAYSTYKLLLIGDGPQKEDLLSEIVKDNGNIVLEDWKSYHELPIFYNKARFFILPSNFEPWGLVVNEAMAAGKPILLSKQCGCMPDFVNNDFGFVFDAYDQAQITEKIDEAVSMSEIDYNQHSEYAKLRIARYDLDNWSNQLKRIVDQC